MHALVLKAAVLAALLCLVPTASVRAQEDDKFERVNIGTIDGVMLRGYYYQATNAKGIPPTVIFVHAIGENSQSNHVKNLAEALRKSCSVMLFDLRGHGESKTIDRDVFWKQPQNLQMVKGPNTRDTIDYKDFDKSYYSIFVNDLAAVKGYVDRKNDTRALNSSSTILIGADTGATLAATWLNSEYYRFKLSPAGFIPVTTKPEGHSVVAAIWLSISPKLSPQHQPVDLAQILYRPVHEGTTSAVFMYGDADTSGKTLAKSIEKRIKSTGLANKFKYTAATEIKGNAKLTGVALLQKSLSTDIAIKEYIANVVADRGNEWIEHEYRKSAYVWRASINGPVLPCKPADVNSPIFDTYDKFMR